MELTLNDYQRAILTGVLVSADNDAEHEGRTGPWVDGVRACLTAINRAENLASWKVAPTGGEPFGTKVTMWSDNWGTRHAIITNAPKPQAEREMMDSDQWGIVIRPDRHGSGGMTYVPADLLTLGWHPEGDSK